jgi:hypothetical protein
MIRLAVFLARGGAYIQNARRQASGARRTLQGFRCQRYYWIATEYEDEDEDDREHKIFVLVLVLVLVLENANHLKPT